MSKRVLAYFFLLLTMIGVPGCAIDYANTPAPDWKNAPNRHAG